MRPCQISVLLAAIIGVSTSLKVVETKLGAVKGVQYK
jgi:hypothetical protein